MALTLIDVTQQRGGTEIVSNLSLRIPPGVTAVMGPNGSGKTTLLKTAAGLLPPDRGAVSFNGIPLYPHEGAVRIGYIPQDKTLSLSLKVRDALHYLATLHGADKTTAHHLLEEWGLQGVASCPVQQLSPGETRRFLIAQAFLYHHDLYIFDEATTGLDALYRPRFLRELLRLRKGGSTILVATHLEDDTYSIADHLLTIGDGAILSHLGRVARGEIID